MQKFQSDQKGTMLQTPIPNKAISQENIDDSPSFHEQPSTLSKYLMAPALISAAFSGDSTAIPLIDQKFPAPVYNADKPNYSNFQEILEKYETVLFSHSAVISNIQTNENGHPKTVHMIVSVDGKDMVLSSPIQSFDFEPYPDMRIMVEGVQRGKEKQLKFRKIKNLKLDEDDKRLLDEIVSEFEKI